MNIIEKWTFKRHSLKLSEMLEVCTHIDELDTALTTALFVVDEGEKLLRLHELRVRRVLGLKARDADRRAGDDS